MTYPNFSQFQKTKSWIPNVATHADYSGWQAVAGYLYCDGRFFIQLNRRADGRAEYQVDTFGGMFTGSLIDCEAEIWHAAIENDAFDSSTY